MSGDSTRFLRGENRDPLKVRECGDHYYADHLSAHTNGLYLDARPVRRWLKQNSQNRRILNLFAHTGSLGIAARLGGAAGRNFPASYSIRPRAYRRRPRQRSIGPSAKILYR